MLAGRGGVHHRGGRSAERHQYLAGVDFTADPAAFEEVAAAALSRAFVESAALVFPKDPPTTSDDGIYSPFIGINPPSLGPMGGFARQIAALEQGPPEAPAPPPSAPVQSRGLIQAVGEDKPEPPEPPPEPPPAPPVVPDDPPPPVVVVIVDTPPPPPPPVPPPADPPRPAPVVIVQTLAATPPAAIPEPGTWAMLLLGFGAIGAALRARRRDRPAAEGSC
jgi:hypothetical protein